MCSCWAELKWWWMDLYFMGKTPHHQQNAKENDPALVISTFTLPACFLSKIYCRLIETLQKERKKGKRNEFVDVDGLSTWIPNRISNLLFFTGRFRPLSRNGVWWKSHFHLPNIYAICIQRIFKLKSWTTLTNGSNAKKKIKFNCTIRLYPVW